MLKYAEKQVIETEVSLVSVVCDICGKEDFYNSENLEVDAYNYVHIKKSFGYGSLIGDDDLVEIDLCEKCFLDKFGKDFIYKCIKN